MADRNQRGAGNGPPLVSWSDYVATGADIASTTLGLVDRVQDPGWRLVRTGVPALDRQLTLIPQESTAILGRPGMGKTTWLEAIAKLELQTLAETREERVVVYVSLEEPDSKLGLKIGGAPFSVRQIYRRDADLSAVRDHALRLPVALDRLVVIRHPGMIGGRFAPHVTPDLILSVCERIAEEYAPPSMVLLDYLQKVGKGDDGRMTEAVRSAAHGSVMIARALNCHVFVAAQAGRQVDDRMPPLPGLGDGLHASDIEHTAANVIGVCRPATVPSIRAIIEQEEGHGYAFKIPVERRTRGPDGAVQWESHMETYQVGPGMMIAQVAKSRDDPCPGLRVAFNLGPDLRVSVPRTKSGILAE